MSLITVLYNPDNVALQHSLFPFVAGRLRDRFVFVRSIDDALRVRNSPSIMLVRYTRSEEYKARPHERIAALRNRFERLAFFDDAASAAALDVTLLGAADFYYKKQLLIDRQRLLDPRPGKRAFTEHNTETPSTTAGAQPLGDASYAQKIQRIRVSWNLGIGSLPRSKRTKAAVFRFEEFFGPKPLRLLYRTTWRRSRSVPTGDFISARWKTDLGNSDVRSHRLRFLERVENHASFRTGLVHQREYNRELKNAFATLSPFGFGEVCYRDFEAAIFRSCLIKPDMSHVETWPDIYLPHQSYVPVKWDASDVIETAEELLRDRPRARRIAENAFDILSDAYNHLDERVEMIVKDLLG